MHDGHDHVVVRQKWTLTQEAFDKLLVALGGGDREAGSGKYLEIRSNLTRFFEWRACSFPEDHADETINRIAKRVAEGEQILNPSGYAMGVARLLLLEILKSRQREQSALTEIGLCALWFSSRMQILTTRHREHRGCTETSVLADFSCKAGPI